MSKSCIFLAVENLYMDVGPPGSPLLHKSVFTPRAAPKSPRSSAEDPSVHFVTISLYPFLNDCDHSVMK